MGVLDTSRLLRHVDRGGLAVPGMAYQRRVPLDAAYRLRPDRYLRRDDAQAAVARWTLADRRPRTGDDAGGTAACGRAARTPGIPGTPAPDPLHLGGARRAPAPPGCRVDGRHPKSPAEP